MISAFFLLSSPIKKKQELPNSIGDPLELVLIKGPGELAINNLISFLNISIGPAPQEEKSLSLIEITNEEFKGLFKRHQNLLFVSKGEQFQIIKKENVFAKNQAVFFLKYPSKSSLIENKNKIKKLLNEIKRVEKKRLLNKYKNYLNTTIKEDIKKRHYFSAQFPKDFFFAYADSNVSWIRRETPKLSQGIVVINLSSPLDANKQQGETLRIIDSVAQLHISGPAPGSYMTTEKSAPMLIEEIQINNINVIQTQSLWKMKNDFMGGIYKSYYFKNPTLPGAQIIYSYLYAPGESKAIPLLQMDAIIFSAKY